jgi:pimeloyl-ACP methyl ester carboxylesterase
MAPAGVLEHFEVRSGDGTVIPVVKGGIGPPLVLVHGAGGPNAWVAVRPLFERTRTVYTLDRRSTFVDPSIPYDQQREFEDVAAVARAAGGDVDLGGQSSGAVCALGASLLIPGLRHLILYEPPFLAATQSNVEHMERLLQEGNQEGAAESFLRDSVKLAPETIAAWRSAPDWPKRAALAPFQIREEAILRAWKPAPDTFRALRLPTLLLVGGKTPADHHHRGYIEFLRAAGVDLTVVEIPGQEHAAHRDAPELFAKLVLEFLEVD